MIKGVKSDVGTSSLANALHMYLSETDRDITLCRNHEHNTAIHTQGSEFQLYKIFKRDQDVCQHLHKVVKNLSPWSDHYSWKHHGDGYTLLQNQISKRTQKHLKLTEIITRGIEWESMPILIHSYKFDADVSFKNELIVPSSYLDTVEILPVKLVGSLLRCHEYLMPPAIIKAQAPYLGHDINFSVISDYLSSSTQEGLYTNPSTNKRLMKAL